MRITNLRLKTSILGVLLIVMFGITISGCGGSGKNGQEVELKLVSAWTPPQTGTEFLQKFVDRVNEEGKGKVQIDLIGGSEVAGASEQLEAVRLGSYDITFNTPNYYAGVVPGALSVYFADVGLIELRNSDYWKLYDQMHRDKAGVTVVGSLWAGDGYAILSKEPIEKADLTGMRFRGTPLFDGMIKELGGVTTSIPMPELYLALDRKVVDATVLPIALAKEVGIFEVTSYVLPIPGITHGPLLMNSEKWDNLPDDAKQVINDVLKELEPEVLPFYKNLAKERLKEAEGKNNVKLVELSKAENEKMIETTYRNAMEFVIKKDPDLGAKGKSAVDKLMKIK